MIKPLHSIISGIVLVLGPATAALAQGTADRFQITGRVLDEQTRRPMEYVNVILYRASDSTLVTGTVTDPDGTYELQKVPEGEYFMGFRFLGYETGRADQVRVRSGPVDLGDLLLVPSGITMGDVVVEGARPTFTYQIDKKVIDVDQISTTISGTAAEVLANIPSVSVDIEGNVSLQGSDNFTVLIDGKPSVLDAQDALQQIPASTIGSIEIITNPSAKHDPEGSAGIINIKMKKNRGRGWSGLANADVGLNDKYGGDMLFQHKDASMTAILGIDYNRRLHPATSSGEERFLYQGTMSTIRSTGDMRMVRNAFGLRGEMEFGVGESGSMTFSGRYGTREWQRNALLQQTSWSAPGAAPVSSLNALHRRRGGDFAALNAGYQLSFDPDVAEHTLLTQLMFRYRDSDELTTSELFGSGIPSGKRTTEAGPSREMNSRIEYVLPFGKNHKFESGYQGEIDISEEGTSLSDYDSTGNYVLLPRFSNRVEYEDNNHALYSLYSGMWGAFGYQAGLRSEYTRRRIKVTGVQDFLIDRWDFFPTLHFSYRFSGESQAMASYTRRIDRPRGWELEPFETWIDANTVRSGNPSLVPEFIDSYEAGFQTLLGEISFSLEGYHRVEHNTIEHIRSVYSDNVLLSTPANVGTEFSSGVEVLANVDPVHNWNATLIGNVYDYRIRGIVLNERFSRQSFNWSTRFNNVIKAGPSTQFQLNARWNSPSVSAQGRREGYASVDVAAKQEFLDKQFSLTLQIQNLLKTARHEYTSEGPGFYSYRDYSTESPVVMLTFRLSINNYSSDKDSERQDGFGGEEGF
jgi:outer membrane cobalamin receptor